MSFCKCLGFSGAKPFGMAVDKCINIISFNIPIYRGLDHLHYLELGHAYISSFEAILAIYRRFNGRLNNFMNPKMEVMLNTPVLTI